MEGGIERNRERVGKTEVEGGRERILINLLTSMHAWQSFCLCVLICQLHSSSIILSIHHEASRLSTRPQSHVLAQTEPIYLVGYLSIYPVVRKLSSSCPVPHHTTPHHTTPHHTTTQHNTPHHTPHHTIPHHTIPHHTIPHHTTPHHATQAVQL